MPDHSHCLVLVAERRRRSDVGSSKAAARPRACRFVGGQAPPRTAARSGAAVRWPAPTPHAPGGLARGRAAA
ncbi:hypothetical protein [Actinomadura luteofluorescens]|uniref:hypothetical protein n=1 Tax=Actinomadura luteofluorescens TaxID=46163 RepID=UPI002164009A|nr:hypothetical protein [Actinomadura glauciflava]